MALKFLQNRAIPYFVGTCGVLATIIVWYDLRVHTMHYYAAEPFLEMYHPFIILLLGLGFSLLLSFTIIITQQSNERALHLRHMNEDLKKEIQDRMAAEETKQKLEVALLQGQKLQAIGTLAGGIAHDFNNLLYAIIGYIELTQSDTPKTSIAYKNLGKVLEAANRGRELISRILAFSRRQHYHFDILNLKTTIEAALALLLPTIPASVLIEFDEKIDVKILGNQTQIHQVLVNIINNAVDALDGEGEIHIKMSFVNSTDPLLKQFPETKAQNYCKISINDSGHGMDQPTMDRIFEPFYTTKEVGKGTGLGLSIVHSIIKEHEGEITVTSQLGHGSTFRILLPVYEG